MSNYSRKNYRENLLIIQEAIDINQQITFQFNKYNMREFTANIIA